MAQVYRAQPEECEKCVCLFFLSVRKDWVHTAIVEPWFQSKLLAWLGCRVPFGFSVSVCFQATCGHLLQRSLAVSCGLLRPREWLQVAASDRLGKVIHMRSLAVTCDHLRSLAVTCGHLRSLAVSCGLLRSLAVTCGHLRSLAASCGHLRSLVVTCGLLRPLEWLQVAASGCKWPQVAASGCKWLQVTAFSIINCRASCVLNGNYCVSNTP